MNNIRNLKRKKTNKNKPTSIVFKELPSKRIHDLLIKKGYSKRLTVGSKEVEYCILTPLHK